jgi:hypothetical protein
VPTTSQLVLAGASFSAWLVLIAFYFYLLPAKGGAFGALTRRPSGSGGISQQQQQQQQQ